MYKPIDKRCPLNHPMVLSHLGKPTHAYPQDLDAHWDEEAEDFVNLNDWG